MDKKLFKLAVAALATVSVMPAASQAEVESVGTFLAAGCGGGGKCGGSTAYNYNNTGANQRDTYNYNTQGQNRPGTDANVDYRASTTNTYGTDTDANANRSSWWSSSSTTTITETDLVKQLSPQGRAIFQSLDSEGKKEAVRLANQENFQDKDAAVREAQRRSVENRGSGFTTGSNTSSYNQINRNR